MTFKTGCAVVALGGALMSGPAAGQTTAGTDLGTLGGDSATAEQINILGAVTGSSHTSLGFWRAFLITAPGEPMVPLGPDGVPSNGHGMNDLNEVVFSTAQAFVQRGPVVRPLGPGLARDINNLGYAAGWRNVTPLELHATVWEPSGTARDLGAAGEESFATAINDRGQVVGWVNDADGRGHAVLWEPDGTRVELGTLGGRFSQAHAINELGDVVGLAETSWQAAHAFLWRREVGMIDLDSGNNFSWAFGVNDVGQVVGERVAVGEPRPTAFVWTAPTDMIALHTPEMPAGQGRATSINDLGEIVGSVADAARSRALRWFVRPSRDQQFLTLSRLVELLADDGLIHKGAAQSFKAKVEAAARADAKGNPDRAADHLLSAAQHLTRAKVILGEGRLVHVSVFAARLALSF